MPTLSKNQLIIIIAVLLVLCALAIIASLLFMGVIALSYSGSRPTATLTATLQAPVDATETTEDSWLKIVESGQMIVGTAADYPPFAFYQQDFQLDGFDVALIRLLGERLGVNIILKDMAFDGLPGALQIGQIDAAIAAISFTQERDAYLDFSEVYFVSEDGVLARADSEIGRIELIEQLANYRVGVQRGSIYEDSLRTGLVETGKMPPQKLLLYQLTDQALGDLIEGRIDLVVMDFLPAETFTNIEKVKIVGRSLNRQRYAIAVDQGATSLRSEINRVLTQLQNEGQISALIEEYIGIDAQYIPTPEPPEPTPLPAPTVNPAPDTCIDGMQFLEDLTYPDNNMANPPVFPPGTPFEKGWRIRNTGTCTWNSSYMLIYGGGNSPVSQMSGWPTPVVGEVLPGDTYDLYLNLVSPPVAGIYQGFWELHNGEGARFGDRLRVGIQVPGDAPPPPTQTPAPGISFSAEPTKINPGERVNFTWRVTGGKAVYFYRQGEDWRQHPVSFIGSQDEFPLVTTIYELRIIKVDDDQEIRQIIIYVDQAQGAPVITTFTVEPGGQIGVGTCVDITWLVDGDVTSVSLLRNSSLLWEDAPHGGAMQDCPTDLGTVIYELLAVGPGGTSQLQRSIEVVQSGN